MSESIESKYGVNNINYLDFIIEKRKKTNREKYGGNAPANSKEIIAKIKQTSIKRFGTDNFMKNPILSKESKIKSIKALSESNKVYTSNQQIYLNNLYNGVLNFPVQFYIADSLIDENILLEYNGGGHNLQVKLGNISEKDFLLKEIRKFYIYKKNNFYYMIIESKKDFLPTDKVLYKMLGLAKEIFLKNHSWVRFDIFNQTIEYRNYFSKYDFGDLRKISSEDIKNAL
jgi:hypothetical protein